LSFGQAPHQLEAIEVKQEVSHIQQETARCRLHPLALRLADRREPRRWRHSRGTGGGGFQM